MWLVLGAVGWLTVTAGEASEPPVPAPLTEVTFALRRPLTERDAATLLARLPVWEERGALGGYVLPLAPPSGGGDPAWQAAMLERVAGVVDPARLVAVTPTVGTTGWEASNNPAYLPYGGRPAVVATSFESWFGSVAAARVGGLALTLEQTLRDPTEAELGAYLDAFLTTCAEAGKIPELWLPAELFTTAEPPALLKALTPERLRPLHRVLLVGAWRAALRLPPEEKPQPAAGDEGEDAGAPEQSAEDPDVKALRRLVARVAKVVPLEQLAVDLEDHPSSPARSLGAARGYLDAVGRAGVGRIVLRGRLDTLQAPLWQEFLGQLAAP